jgi:hypothetical protein
MHRPAAELGTSLARDWVPMPHFRAGTISATAFEDAFPPDVFGLQPLGA